MVTYGNFIIGLRSYIEEVTGLTTIWRYPNYIRPNTRQYIAIEFVNNGYTNDTKLKELVSETIYFNLAIYDDDVVSLSETQSKVNEILMHHTIPLMNANGDTIGKFSVDRISSTMTIPFGTHSEEESESIRSYTDFVVELAHVRVNK